jgi:penicillin-binding protein 1C
MNSKCSLTSVSTALSRSFLSCLGGARDVFQHAVSRALQQRRTYILLLLVLAGGAFWRCLPEPLFNEPVSSVLLARDGELLAAHIATDGQWRFPPIDSVPGKFRQAIITFEDKRFESHPGVDPLALFRALYLNLQHRRVVSGGSTLTMQVIRLARHNQPRTILEKLHEIILALRLELSFNKAKVLALYADHAPFGGNVVGLQAAAWRYFSRSPQQLSWAEAATLAVLPNNPALIHPGRGRERLLQKRNTLLQRLHATDQLSAVDLRLALLEALPAAPQPLPRIAPHLLDTLANQYPGQHRFVTTLDRRLQEKVEAQAHAHAATLALQQIHNLAVLVIDNSNFEVLAYVGNSAYHGNNDYAYAVDIVQRPRSTGSILKPLLFATMIQHGEILPTTLIPDLPTQYAGYMPENFDRNYRGAVSAQAALARSLNVPAVRMLRQYGVDRFYEYLHNAGMSTLHRRAENYGLSLILGGAEGTVWDMAGLYANLAYLAKQLPTPQQPLYYGRLKVLQSQSNQTQQLAEIGPAAAWTTLNALVEVSRPGQENYWEEFASSRKLAWKTGTSFGMRDAWAIGSDPRYTIAVWAGNATGEGRPEMTGVQVAAPLLFNIFNQLDAPPHWFDKPVELMKPVRVCKADGFLVVEGCETQEVWIPKESQFDRSSPHFQLIHLDRRARWQVSSDCEQVSRMQHKSWFVLPEAQAFYYQRSHPEYRPLPPFRADCRAQMAQQGSQGPIDLLYPLPNTRLYIPIDLAAQKSKTVFEAVHARRDAILYWHMDDQYLGKTTTFHQQALDIQPGQHLLTLVDDHGNRLQRRFEVLGK